MREAMKDEAKREAWEKSLAKQLLDDVVQYDHKDCFYDGYDAGYAAASRWRSIEDELAWFYSQERNVELSSFWDRGWRLRFGDETNGFTDDGWFDSLDDVATYLREERQKIEFDDD